MGLLTESTIAAELGSLSGWRMRDSALERTFDRKNFDGSIAFVNAVATVANERDHHPDIAISWNEVTLRLSSHDAGGITDRDVALARAIDALA